MAEARRIQGRIKFDAHSEVVAEEARTEYLDSKYATFSEAAESYQLDVTDIETKDYYQYQGRGRPRKIVKVPSQAPTKPDVQFKSVKATFWSQIRARNKQIRTGHGTRCRTTPAAPAQIVGNTTPELRIASLRYLAAGTLWEVLRFI